MVNLRRLVTSILLTTLASVAVTTPVLANDEICYESAALRRTICIYVE